VCSCRGGGKGVMCMSNTICWCRREEEEGKINKERMEGE